MATENRAAAGDFERLQTLHYVEASITVAVWACSPQEAEAAAPDALSADFARHLPDFEYRAITADEAWARASEPEAGR